MKQTSLQGIANKATQDKTYRFRNLFGMLTVGYLFWCWDFINRKASAGVDRIDAQAYEENLLPNIEQLVKQVKENTYRAKLVLRKYIPKTNGKLRRLGIPVIADKLLQREVAKILEAIWIVRQNYFQKARPVICFLRHPQRQQSLKLPLFQSNQNLVYF